MVKLKKNRMGREMGFRGPTVWASKIILRGPLVRFWASKPIFRGPKKYCQTLGVEYNISWPIFVRLWASKLIFRGPKIYCETLGVENAISWPIL